MIDYNSKLNQRARTLRRNMTPWERKLWYTFLRTYPIKFYRQRIIGNYIADFYCSEAKLVIELDGGGHYQKSQQEYDEFRTRVLQAKGFSVLRFSNLDVDKNFYGVCTEIDKVVKQLTPQSATLTAPLTVGREQEKL